MTRGERRINWLRRSPIFGLAIPLLMAFLLASSSGCLFPCRTHVMTVIWRQDDAPVPESQGGRTFTLDDLWGSAWRKPDGAGEIYLNVHSNRTVSHEDAVRFANALFAHEGWPAPQLGNAREEARCGDHL